MKTHISWSRYEGNVKYRVTFRSSMGGEQIGVLDNLVEPQCQLPDQWGVLPTDAVARIEVAQVSADRTSGDWFTWLPFFQITPQKNTGLSIKSPIDGGEFPVRLRVRAVGEDLVLLDLVLRSTYFFLAESLKERKQVRYKFLRFDRESRKWIDVHDYQLLDILQLSDTALAVGERRGSVLRNELDLVSADLAINRCPFCGDALTKVDDGQNCKGCGCRARLRSLRPLLDQIIAPLFDRNREALAKKPLLAVSMTAAEKKALSSVFHAFKSVSLFGDYSGDHETGVDIRNLSRYADSNYCGVFSCGVFDYFIEHEEALRECFRVIAPGGLFITHILPNRLSGDREPPVSKGSIIGRPGYLEYLRKGQEFADVLVGRDWFLDAMRRAGFIADVVTVRDVVPGLCSVWFIGIKPAIAIHEISFVEYVVRACPLCGDPLSTAEDGQNCKGCGSRARLRSMAPLMHEYLTPRLHGNAVAALPLLAFAMTGAEKKFLSDVFHKFKSVSLFGNYASGHESGVDMRDLSRYAPESFSGVFGCLLFDYFPEHEKALQECFRVIAPGGIFFTHIAPYRIVNGDTEPELKGVIKSRAGYFEYLPEKTDLPDVKVGRNWFVAAMRRVGFESVIIKVMDAVPGLFSEWYVGIKPGKLTATPSRVKASTTSKAGALTTRVSEVFRSVVPYGEGGRANLIIELIEATRGTLFFLEDCQTPAPDSGGELREIVATNGSRNLILLSRDKGRSWLPQYESMQWDSQIRGAFSLSDGGRLVRTFSGRMYHFDTRGELLNSSATAVWHWHGSQGIGQSVSGTVMYAEYAPLQDADGVQELNVWRYRPKVSDAGWQKVLTLPAAVRPSQGELRHFHVCRPHPAIPRQWMLASGDVGAHCRLWQSNDDGDSWSEVPLLEATLVNMPEETYPRLLRFTQFAVLENGDLIWGTDDTTGSGCAALIRTSLMSNSPTFHFLGWLGKNCIRNIIECSNNRFLLISESKHDSSSADCILYDATTGRITSLLLPNLSQASHSVTDSLGSMKLVKGTGFFPAPGAVLMNPEKRGIFRITIVEVES